VTASPEVTASPATTIIAALTERELTIAVAESLTGGLLVSSLVAVPGASKVVLGGVVAYNTAIKASVLGVDRTLLAACGPRWR
jgi:nicotinamide-nucleotide amidase